jgi:hypothetical protein
MIRLSHSALDTLHTCERKFQLDRLLVSSLEKQQYPATVLGTAYGAGVQSYLVHQDQDKAIFDCYMAYFPILEEAKRTEEHALSLLLASFPQLDKLLEDWEVATFQDKPAIELSFRLNIDEKFYYVGYVDVVLRNKWTNTYAIGEIKTTSLQLHDLSPIYQNSGQALGYSIILDAIVGEENSQYDTIYVVGQLNEKHNHKIQTYNFNKSLLDRLNWFITLGMDVEKLHKMLDVNVFPMRGSNCLQYMRPCIHFGTCQLHGLDEYKEEEIDEIEYQFIYQLDEVVQNHLSRIGE